MSGQTPKRIGNYEVTRLIGTGGERQVYEAICRVEEAGIAAGSKVALHCLRDRERHLFEREAEILGSLRHPNILRYHHSFIEATPFGDQFCLVTELLEGEPLSNRIHRSAAPDGGLPWPEIAGIVAQILEALQDAAARGVIHRDLKPSNIFITRNGKAKLIDFGIASRCYQPGDTRSVGEIKGSFDYMAPEFSRQADVNFRGDERSDIFSFGVCLFQAVTGRLPFKEIANGQIDHYLRWTAADLPQAEYADCAFQVWAGLRACIARCLEVDPRQRPASFSEVAAAVAAVHPFRVPPPDKPDVYEFINCVGAGGFGEVFRARHLRFGKPVGEVAVKRLLHARYSKRFEREAAILKELNHPNLVRYVDFRRVESDFGPQFYLVLEYLKGESEATLRSRLLQAPGGLDATEMLRLFLSYLDALDFLHRHEIIHRDIKPHNLYAPPGDPSGGKVFDLGIALDQSGTQTRGQIPGSWDYMPPEFGRDSSERGTPQSDVYAVGVTLYQALTGELPHAHARTLQDFLERIESPAAPAFTHPVFREFPKLEQLLRMALADEPRQRFASAKAMHAEISQILRFKQLSQAPTQAGDWSIVLERVETALDAKDWPEAAKLARGVLERAPENSRAAELLAVAEAITSAQTAGAAGDWAAASRRLHEGLGRFPDSPFLKRAVADAELRAVEFARQATPGWRRGAAREALDYGDYTRAIDLCGKLAREHPNDEEAAALFSAARTLQNLEDAVRGGGTSEVIQMLESFKAANAGQKFVRREAIAALGAEAARGALAGEQFELAATLSEITLRIVPDFAAARQVSEACHLVRDARDLATGGYWKAAGAAFRSALERVPGNRYVLAQVRIIEIREAQAAAVSGDYEAARQLCDARGDVAPGDPATTALREILSALLQAKVLGQGCNWPRAVEVLQAARTSFPSEQLASQDLTGLDGVLQRSIGMATAELARQQEATARVKAEAERILTERRRRRNTLSGAVAALLLLAAGGFGLAHYLNRPVAGGTEGSAPEMQPVTKPSGPDAGTDSTAALATAAATNPPLVMRSNAPTVMNPKEDDRQGAPPEPRYTNVQTELQKAAEQNRKMMELMFGPKTNR